MASRLTKLCPRILLSSTAVFILLSVTTGDATGVEPTRCYWCGPLAEQVHRSQRAPSCDNFALEQHQTTCDKGYTHCAIVAASPPYAESRLCVKFYQDECYSLYCNSTKTWGMVCACRGDLCNGQHTERETKAFAVLPRALGKSHPRNKRSLIAGFISVKTSSPADNKTVIILNKKHNETIDISQLENSNLGNATMNIIPKNIEENIIIEHGTIRKVENSLNATQNKAEDNENMADDDSDKAIATGNLQLENAGTDNQITNNLNKTAADIENANRVNAKTNKPTHIAETTLVDAKETGDNVTPSTVMKPTSNEIEVAVLNTVTPVKLPAAEALQQNVTPTKAMELTTVGTVFMSTDNTHMVETTTRSMLKEVTNEIDQMKKSNCAQNSARLAILVISFLAPYYL